ncbi:MAG: RluA family pseudouridine synthase [Spirochaetales bacterium]|nr:RluA family pseudouridine synthase [Spirochaetales bacterium]
MISKNSGLAVQGGANIKHSIDVDFAEEIGQKIFLVHRLDKDTAGLMIVAKNPAAAAKWTKLISGKTVKKEYIAICAGTIEPKKGIICEKIVQHGEEKKAVTNYEVEKEIETECGKLSQIRLLLETGRMHQIRIHLAKNSCPIAGDDQHGNFKLNKQLKKTLGIKKLLLASVKLTVPLQSKNQVFEIPLPEYMCF